MRSYAALFHIFGALPSTEISHRPRDVPHAAQKSIESRYLIHTPRGRAARTDFLESHTMPLTCAGKMLQMPRQACRCHAGMRDDYLPLLCEDAKSVGDTMRATFIFIIFTPALMPHGHDDQPIFAV